MLSLRPKPIEQTHEEVFLQRYEKLFGWLCQLTDGDREFARDLVQDAFVHFTFVRPDLRLIQNLDGYLFALARNLHVSQVRRPTNSRLQQLSILDYDSSEWGLRMTDVREQIQVQDELRRICHYACVRKETAWAGSVLILRFFYGYYASEIARILRNTRASVDVLLRCARHEAKAYLKSPQTLAFMKESSVTPLASGSFARERQDFLEELRQVIFSSRQGDCLTLDQLKSLYLPVSDQSFSCVELAHIVSCEACLNVINELLHLSPLSERHPVATIGREPRDREGKGKGGGGGLSGGAGGEDLRSIKRHAEETFDHKPNELYVAVNGYTLGSHKINSKRSELTLDVNVNEPIEFIEVFSEQLVRLLFANVEDPPAGPIKQPVSVALSDNRHLGATLRFRSPWPSLHVEYSDPAFLEIDDALIAAYEQAPDVPLPLVHVDSATTYRRIALMEIPNRALGVATGSIRRFFTPRIWLNPATVTIIFALSLVAALLWVNRRTPTLLLSAANLLQRSSAAEEVLSSRTDLVLHRTISLEERALSGPGAGSSAHIKRSRIEIWQSTEKGITARRLYDERGVLIAGDWRRSDGVQTIFHHGSRPQLQMPNAQFAVRTRDVWQLSPSAKEFTSLIDNAQSAQLVATANSYLISYAASDDRVSTADQATIIRATLTLSRADLQATELTLTLCQGSDLLEYRMTEASFERRTPSTVAPMVFEPEPELIGDTGTRGNGDTSKLSASPRLPIAPSLVAASAELEVEVLSLLSKAGADLDDQTSVTRTAEGKLHVSGLVDTEQRKLEIKNALVSVARNPAVKIEIETVAEALSRRARQQAEPGAQTVERVEVNQSAIPAYEDLHRYFPKASEEEIGRFSARMVNRSAQAMSHAGVLRRLVKQFSQEDLRTLNPEARSKWLSMIRVHARAFQDQMGALRRDLQPIFFRNSPGATSQGEVAITDDASLLRAVERLYEVGAANDQVIRSAFTASSVESGAGVKSVNFWRSLQSSEVLAAQIQAVQ